MSIAIAKAAVGQAPPGTAQTTVEQIHTGEAQADVGHTPSGTAQVAVNHLGLGEAQAAVDQPVQVKLRLLERNTSRCGNKHVYRFRTCSYRQTRQGSAQKLM
jgi:hypothetical protein